MNSNSARGRAKKIASIRARKFLLSVSLNLLIRKFFNTRETFFGGDQRNFFLRTGNNVTSTGNIITCGCFLSFRCGREEWEGGGGRRGRISGRKMFSGQEDRRENRGKGGGETGGGV